jgi:hypothetical protein
VWQISSIKCTMKERALEIPATKNAKEQSAQTT